MNFCTPVELKDTLQLAEISDATVPVTSEEAATWAETVDTPKLMRDAVNAVISGARSINASIQTINDINRHLARHPENDETFTRLLISSGYLSRWRIEKDQNPWQYNLDLMRACPEAQIEGYCWEVLHNELGGSHRFMINRGGYELLARQFRLQYFCQMGALYERLAILHFQRVQVAQRWLEEQGALVSLNEVALVPHTPEWFALLATWNPAQATQTREILRLAGRTDVCSVCGDDSARDYRLAVAARPPCGIDTLRLCNDCLDIRRQRGDPFE